MDFKVRRWRLDHAPERPRFRGTSAATYLGYVMGPDAGARVWAASSGKWAERARLIRAVCPPARVAAVLCTKRAISVVGYVAQLRQPPAALEEGECQAVSCAVSPPGAALSRRWQLAMTEAGGARLGSALACVIVCRVRTARMTPRDIWLCFQSLGTCIGPGRATQGRRG